MDFVDKISNDIKEAMKARQQVRLDALRGIKKELIEAKTAKSADAVITDEEALKIIQRMVKQRKDSAEIFREQNRPDLMEKELEEAGYIAVYLPAQLSAQELETALKAIIAQVGATSAKDMGRVMGVATKELSGKAEGKEINRIVKELLG